MIPFSEKNKSKKNQEIELWDLDDFDAQKKLQYQELRAMREEIKAVEKLRKTAEQLEKDAQPKEKKRNEPER